MKPEQAEPRAVNSGRTLQRRRWPVRRLLRAGATVVLTAVTAACGTGITANVWLWCKQNLAAVDTAAEGLGYARSQAGLVEPRWWADYVTSTLSFSNALISRNADFLASCDVAATAEDIGDTRVVWCLTDGVDKAWAASVTLGLMETVAVDTFAYNAVPLDKRLDNDDFVKACKTAYASRA